MNENNTNTCCIANTLCIIAELQNNAEKFDCGSNSGWLYSVNGSTPSYGCSKYQVKPGDNIVFYYKCG